jgi:hypothetical protein
MTAQLQGLVQGNTVVLDEAVPALEGRRVRVVLEPVEAAPPTTTREQRAEAWRAWIATSPQGPIKE